MTKLRHFSTHGFMAFTDCLIVKYMINYVLWVFPIFYNSPKSRIYSPIKHRLFSLESVFFFFDNISLCTNLAAVFLHAQSCYPKNNPQNDFYMLLYTQREKPLLLNRWKVMYVYETQSKKEKQQSAPQNAITKFMDPVFSHSNNSIWQIRRENSS